MLKQPCSICCGQLTPPGATSRQPRQSTLQSRSARPSAPLLVEPLGSHIVLHCHSASFRTVVPQQRFARRFIGTALLGWPHACSLQPKIAAIAISLPINRGISTQTRGNRCLRAQAYPKNTYTNWMVSPPLWMWGM
ncbi:hypothetical protein Q31a_25760 [Aureliella helgolandensis]|uniref:Uncharacterized protein n=1 Tax=Aureliella helgolandensis TaxID=2527968 RepID=A0A518G6Q4_9BACT|nr:hypothetical protein Q31a_25760 [Aureliella helgolandensis]